MTSRRLSTALFGTMIAIGWLAPAEARGVPVERQPGVSIPEVTVRVVNNNWSDMRVYVVQDQSNLVRLGTVASFTTSKFRLPRWFNPASDHLTFVARGIGGQSNVTPPILVEDGDLVELRIESNISTTNVRVVSGSQ